MPPKAMLNIPITAFLFVFMFLNLGIDYKVSSFAPFGGLLAA
jgi:hypothetical protein